MRSLLLMRHAKSDRSAARDHDHDRPLNDRGVRSAKLMGQFLAQTDQAPELVLASTATRALSTAHLAAESGRWGAEICPLPQLYGAGPAAMMALARRVDPAIGRLMLVGHEPGISQAVSYLLGRATVRFPTAAVACLQVAEWPNLGPECGRLLWFLPSRLLLRRDRGA